MTLVQKLESLGIIFAYDEINSNNKKYFIAELLVDPEEYLGATQVIYSDGSTKEEALLRAVCKLPEFYKFQL